MEQNIIKSGEWGSCLWGIDDTGFLVIGEGTGESLEKGTPWEEFRKIITNVTIDGKVEMPKGASLKGMFKDCQNLTRVDFGQMDTTEVVDMSSMFENCISLKTLDLTSFKTFKTEDMGRMFSGCRNLANLDLSSFNTMRTRDMHHMFSRCNKLQGLVLGDKFSLTGNGRTDCGNLSVRETGKYKIAKVVNVKGGTVTYYENRGRRGKVERETLSDFAYVIEENTFEKADEEYKFFGWCDSSDGKGTMYLPGQELESVDDDLKLYAIWICPPKIGRFDPIPEITYGMPLDFTLPEISSVNDDSIYGFLEISPTGEEGTWRPIERNAILPVACNGYKLRLNATNKCGTSLSNPVTIKIKKAGVDLSRVRWAETPDMEYDGTPKQVWLEGLPEGVTPVYGSNYATEAGNYSATVELQYDSDNYDIPVRIKEHNWSIRKSQFDMSAVHWNYEDAFEYDGTEKAVILQGLPIGVTATYEGNTAVNAGINTALATLQYDGANFEAPEAIKPCVWEIKKKCLAASSLSWSSCDDFVYDGYDKLVEITNLPEDAVVEYQGNNESAAGRYLARANVVGNYFTNAPVEYEWEIRKAKYNMSDVKWDYATPFTYDKEAHEVLLNGVPAGLTVKYQSNMGTDAGDYDARATFSCIDPHNYMTPGDMTLTWSIRKAVADMSNVKWNYSAPFEYDGSNKSVELTGLPAGVYAVIENGSASRAGVYIAHAVLKYDEKNVEVEQPADCQWQINKTKIDVSPAYWSYTSPFTYDGEPKSVSLIGLPEGINVEYQDNIKMDSGKYVATAKLTPSDTVNYEIPEINGCAWSIRKSVLDKGDIVWSDDSEFVYDGTEKSVSIISDISDKIRVEYTGDREINAGSHEAVAHFYPTDTLNYEAPKSVHYRWFIQKGDFKINSATWDYSGEFTYDGKKKTVQLTDVPEGVIVHYENNSATDVGDYTAVASFELMNDENYNPLEPVTLKWSITKAAYDMSRAAWQEQKTFSYDGEEKALLINGLPEGITPVYTDNTATAAGEYVASVGFKYDEHNYEKPSFQECRWMIEKSVFDIGNARWDYETPYVYDGKEKIVRVIDMPEGATVEYENAAATKAGIYFATADVIAEDSFNFYHTSMENLAWKIEKGDYDMSSVKWDYDKAFTYDGSEKTVVLKGLPEGVTPIYSGNQGVETGEYTASVSFKINDYDNYNVPEFADCAWRIDKADIDMSTVQWSYTGEIPYTGVANEITLKGLPKGVKPIYAGNCETNVGKYTATAELVLYDGANFNTPDVQRCNWEIVKADYDMSGVRWDYESAKTYNSREQGIYLENLPNGVTASYTENEAVNVGRYSAAAQLSVEDPANFNIPVVGGCDWEIIPADIDMSEAEWNFVPGSFSFDGKEKKIAMVNLPEVLNVKYSGETATGAGKYTAVAEFGVDTDNFNVPATRTFDWTIEKSECDMSNVKWNYTDEFTYDGKPHGIELTGVPSNVTVSYENNAAVGAGRYDAVAKFSVDADNYFIPEPMTCSWVINKANIDISGIRWDYDQVFTYDATEKKIELAGVPRLLRANYTGNTAVEAGKYTARADFVLVGPDNYNVPASMTTTWDIVKANYDMSSTRWIKNRTFTYDGTEKSIALEGYPEAIRPVYNVTSATVAGTYNASAVFEYDTNNFNEPTVEGCKWFIEKNTYDMSDVYWDYGETMVYDGTEKSVELKGLPAGVSPVYSNNAKTDAGEYFAEATFRYDDANYIRPTFEGCKWKIELAEIPVKEEELSWAYSDAFTYDGTVKGIGLSTYMPEVPMIEQEEEQNLFGKLFGGRKAVEVPAYEPEVKLVGVPEGFEAVYEENEKTEVGVYYAKATLRHSSNPNYKAYVVPGCRWEIKKAKLDLSGVRWDYSQSFTYDGEVKEVHLVGVPEQLKATYTDNTAVKAGSYEAKATFELIDEKNYEKPKPIKGCWWKIDKARYDMSGATWMYSDDLVYNGKEKVVKVSGLPDGVRVESYTGNKAVEAGAYTATVSFRFRNSDNFETPEMPPLRWKIQKRKIDIDSIEWNYNESTLFVYDEQIKEIKLIGVPADVDVVYVNNSKIDAGTYVAKAKLTYDTKNYVADDVPDCIWKIEKATFDTSKVHWSYERPFRYDGDIKKIVLRNVPKKIDVRYMDNKASEIGSYTAKAYLTYNTSNYNTPNIDTTIEWEIVR